MLYAVVDIETTGGYAAHHGITEIAILIYDGVQVINRYQTLINPHQSIPIYIQALTGIDNEMVSAAPDFRTVAAEIYTLLHDKVFVAHNVNFDYSFVKHHLDACGYTLNCKKLCTVRLSRKIFPGFSSYSLGKLCASLAVPLSNRHRADGDASATAIVLGMLIEKDTDGIILDTLKRSSKEQTLPPNLQKVEIDKLPDNMTLGDLSDLLAYSNSKLILPGYEVEYTTPDNSKFKTYQEASNHISKLFNDIKDVDSVCH